AVRAHRPPAALGVPAPAAATEPATGQLQPVHHGRLHRAPADLRRRAVRHERPARRTEWPPRPALAARAAFLARPQAAVQGDAAHPATAGRRTDRPDSADVLPPEWPAAVRGPEYTQRRRNARSVRLADAL